MAIPAKVIARSEVQYVENAAAVALSPFLTIEDDNFNLFGAKISIQSGYQAGQDLLSFTSQFGITGSFNAATGVLTLSGTATLMQYQTVLRSVKYINSSDSPVAGDRSVRFEVNDGNFFSHPLNNIWSYAHVNVIPTNDRPVISGLDTMLYTGAAQGLKQAIDTDLTLSDVDSNTMNVATVRISGHYVPGQDVLSFVPQNGILSTFNAATGTLILFGQANISAYQTALRSVTYSNTQPVSTDVADRTVSFNVLDSAGAWSTTASATIMFAVAPVITTSPGTSAYTEGGATAVVDGTLTVTDLDTPTLTGATVSISVGFQVGDMLAFVDTAIITGSYNAATGVLTLTGTDTLAAYQAALRTITFETTNDDPPVTKTVSWSATDGEYTSIPATRNITITPVNDAPVIDALDAVLPYTENDLATVIAPDTTVTDPDSANFNGGTLTAAFTANGTVSDQLAIRHEGTGAGQIGVSGTNVSYGGAVIGTVADGVNGTALVITFTTNAATQAAVQALARNITFANTSENPSTDPRTVTFTVVDGDGTANGGDQDGTTTATVTVGATNDLAVVTTTAGTAAYIEGAPGTAVDSTLTVTVVDDANLANAVVSISAGFQVGDELGFLDTPNISGSYDAGTGVLTLTGTDTVAAYEAALRSITFRTTSNDDPGTSRTVSWVVNDGVGDSAAATRGIAVTPVNDAPVLNLQGAAPAYTENDTPLLIAPAATVVEPDSDSYNGGVVIVSFSANGAAEDTLAIRNEGTGAGQIGVSGANVTYGGVTIGSFSGGAGGGSLTISFTSVAASTAAVQALIRNITYSNSSDNPSTADRSINISVTDPDGTLNGGADSADETLTLTVAAATDAPVAVDGGGSASYTEGGAAAVVDAGLTISDVDDTNIDSAVMMIAGNFQAGDALVFVGQNGISGSYNTGTGVLTLTGSSSVANYQTALRSVTFQTTNDDPAATRSIQWAVNDGDLNSNTVSHTVNVTPVNDAPVVTSGATLAYTENDAATAIDAAATVADPDSTNFDGGSLKAEFTSNGTSADQLSILHEGNLAGQIGVSGANVSYGGVLIGTVVAGGANGTNLVIDFNSAAATPAAVQALARKITFENNSNAPSTLAREVTFTVVDGDGTANGGDDDGTTTATVNVTAVNDAPVVTTSGGDTAFTEAGDAVVIDGGITVTDIDSANMSSATVQITGGYLTGFDTLDFTALGDVGNIAVDSFNAGTGTLTLISAGGTATALQWEAALRLVKFGSTSPGPGPSRDITFLLDDGDGDSHVSTQQVKNIAITETNSAPVINAQAAVLGYTENAVAAVIASGTTVTDADSTDFMFGSLKAELTAAGSADDRLAINNQGTNAGEIGVSGADVTYGGAVIGTFTGGTGTTPLVITFTTAAATPAAVQALARNITFANVSDTPSTSPRTVTFTVVDGDGTANGGDDNGTTTAIVNVTAANDAPVVTTSAGDTAFTEDSLAVVIDGGLTVTDIDSANMSSATVQITGGYLTGFDTLAFTALGDVGNIAVDSFNAGNGKLTLISAGGTATALQWQTALRLVEFDSTSDTPGATRVISFELDDGDGDANLSTVVTKNIAITQINSAPELTGGGDAAFAEHDAAVIVDGALVVADSDSATLVGATVSITTGFATAEDVLTFTPTGSITGSYVAATGVLTLSGSGTVAEYQQVLSSVKYDNPSHTPSATPRTIEFQVDDGQGVSNLSNVTSVTMSVTPVNDAPVATTSGGTAAYTEDGVAALIDANLAVSDLDDTNLNSATVRISGGFDAGDVLNFVNTANISGSYNAGTATLTLTGVDTLGNYQTALRSISFSGTSQSPTLTKTVEWVVNDGDANSVAVTRDISVSSVNDAPQLTGSSAVSYTENAPLPTNLLGSIAVADIDSDNIASATVTISGGFAAGQDVLTFTNSGGITGSYNAATGVLTTSGTDTKAQFQIFLQSIGYQNTSDNPNTSQRTISFQVNDGNLLNNLSNTVTSTVDIIAVNDKPTITGVGNAASYTENAAPVLIDSALTLADAESNSITGATVSISANFTTGQDVLAFTDSGADNITGNYNAATGVLTLSGTDTLANYDAAFESITYQNTSENPATAPRTISYSITDNGTPTPESSATVTGTVNVTAVNDAPVNTVPTSASLGAAMSNVDFAVAGISVSDVDVNAGDLQTTVTVTNGTVNFNLAGGATIAAGALNSTTVTLQGTVAELNAALDTFTFKGTDGISAPIAANVTVVTNDMGNTGQDPGLTGTGTTEQDSDAFQIAVIPQVWFIDGSVAVNGTGTQASPFKTIADFNTAAAAADGPGPNDYIYLKAGTYTGPGINLENGQTLLGDDQALSFSNPLGGPAIDLESATGARPTINVTTAGDQAIDLASNNTVRGVNITTAAGTSGLDDGTAAPAPSPTGGSVGNLTVSSMDISGAGQAVDIDQGGGTLSVALGTLSSTGGAHNVQLSGAGMSGSFSATGGALSGAATAGFQLGDGAGTLNTGGTFSVTYAGSVITTGTARSVDLQDRGAGAGNITFSGEVSHTGGSNGSGVLIDDIAAGTIAFSGNNTYNTGTANAILVTDITAGSTITFSGNLDVDTTTGAGILTSANAGALNFTGGQVTINTTTGPAVSLGGTGTTTFNLSGNDLDIVTNGGVGFVANNIALGGTVSVLGDDNTISAVNGTGLSVTNTNIGASDLSFESIASSGAVNGIVLNNTGSSGGLNITGTGALNSGGTIQNTTGGGAGIVLTNTIDTNLNWVRIQNTDGHGIHATNLGGASKLWDSLITDFGNGNNDDGIHLENTSTNGTLDIQRTDFTASADGNDGIFAEGRGSSIFTLTVNQGDFTGLWGEGIQAMTNSSATGTMNVNITNNNFLNSAANGNGGIALSPSNGAATFNGTVTNNVLDDIMKTLSVQGHINVTVGDVDAGVLTTNFVITGNTITDNTTGHTGVRFVADGSSGPSNLTLSSNTIDNMTGEGVLISARGTVSDLDVIMANNQIGVASSGNIGSATSNGVFIDAQFSGRIDIQMTGNTINAQSDLETVAFRAFDPGSILNVTTGGNTIRDNGGDFLADTEMGFYTAGGTITYHTTSNNTFPAFTGASSIDIFESSGSIQFTHANDAALAAAHGIGAGNTTNSTESYGAAAPPLPTILLSAATPADGGTGEAIDGSVLPAFVVEAIARWAAAGATAEQLTAMNATTFSVEDLGGLEIGNSQLGHITLDVNAAGHGWFIDTTLWDDAEFAGSGTDLQALAGSAAEDRMDLLTAVMHELGHQAGLADTYGHAHDEAMSGLLELGERHLLATLVGVIPTYSIDGGS